MGLTLPSSGPPPACGLRRPLMSLPASRYCIAGLNDRSKLYEGCDHGDRDRHSSCCRVPCVSRRGAGCDKVSEVIGVARAAGMDFAVARLESVRAQAAFDRFGITERLGENRVFHSVEEAIRALAGAA